MKDFAQQRIRNSPRAGYARNPWRLLMTAFLPPVVFLSAAIGLIAAILWLWDMWRGM